MNTIHCIAPIFNSKSWTKMFEIIWMFETTFRFFCLFTKKTYMKESELVRFIEPGNFCAAIVRESGSRLSFSLTNKKRIVVKAGSLWFQTSFYLLVPAWCSWISEESPILSDWIPAGNRLTRSFGLCVGSHTERGHRTETSKQPPESVERVRALFLVSRWSSSVGHLRLTSSTAAY